MDKSAFHVYISPYEPLNLSHAQAGESADGEKTENVRDMFRRSV